MQAQIIFLTRRARGVSLKSTKIEADALRIGRSAASEILLPDVRVGLAEAEIRRRDGVLRIEQVGDDPMRVNGAPVGAAALKIGDEISIGPYKLVVVEPTDGSEAAITVELVSPLGDDFARVQAQTRIGLARTRLSKRGAAWALFAVVAALFLALPIASFHLNGRTPPRQTATTTATPRRIPAFADLSWNAGEISDVHKTFADNCRACHEAPFTAVRDEACVSCHADVPHHIDVRMVKVAALETTRCASCHAEHKGAQGTILTRESLCTDCHADIKRVAPQTALLNAGAFGKAHPQFRASLVADAAQKKIVRVSLAAEPKPVDHPNLKFPHQKHLHPKGWPRGMKKLVCADCHTAEPGGGAMLPISFERHCASCHGESLKYDPLDPNATVPHGKPVEAQQIILDHYARIALEERKAEIGATDPTRRVPGRAETTEERMEALAWAKRKAGKIEALVFDDRRGCGTCHTVERGAQGYTIAPVLLRTHFLPMANFNHARHSTIDCAGCHAADTSTSSSDVLLPRIETCTACHGGETASAKVPSTCISCHDFHRHGLPPMRRPAAAPERTATR
jgi:predicted CXXCH cytochrome family protein